MATKKSSANPYQWSDGTWHSIPASQHEANQNGGSVYVNGQRVTPEQYKAGVFLQGLNASAAVQGTPGTPDLSPPPQPVDPAYEEAKRSATWNTQLGGAEAAYQTGQTAYNTGFDANGQRNFSNPYSDAMLLQENFKRQQAGTNNSMAAAGQLYSGANLNAQAHNDRVQAQGMDALQRQAADTYHGIGVGQLQSYASNSLGVSNEAYGAAKRAVYGG